MNNSFSQSIANICGLELATLVNDYKFSVFGGHTAVIEGHKGVVEYSTETVSFAVKKGTLRISGNDLRIKCLEKHFAVVVGAIISVEVKGNEK
ncbi:MAG: YabP/YqfC family sporulation protein [Clostridiales bacterium]|nr:YabP/YqfC family sporulation protein [Clostridiales bacterium]